MNERRRASTHNQAFTLVELLTVVAIIALLIGILVPALSRARTQAKVGATRAVLKAMGEGLDLFRNENPEECRSGEGYPSSAWRDDPTEPGLQKISGAQWLVRYLMGKTLDGYIPRRTVPRAVFGLGSADFEEAYWYDYDRSHNPLAPLDRVGPYLPQDRVVVKKPLELPGFDILQAQGGSIYSTNNRAMHQPVFLDTFDYPILFYSANTAMYRRAKTTAPLAGRVDSTQAGPTDVIGIYTHEDNGLFTGLEGTSQNMPEWPLGMGNPNADMSLKRFGDWTGGMPMEPREFLDPPANRFTFPYYILNKTVFESTKKDAQGTDATVTPYRADSFLLISPGVDGIYGSEDDINNFAF